MWFVRQLPDYIVHQLRFHVEWILHSLSLVFLRSKHPKGACQASETWWVPYKVYSVWWMEVTAPHRWISCFQYGKDVVGARTLWKEMVFSTVARLWWISVLVATLQGTSRCIVCQTHASLGGLLRCGVTDLSELSPALLFPRPNMPNSLFSLMRLIYLDNFVCEDLWWIEISCIIDCNVTNRVAVIHSLSDIIHPSSPYT